MPTENSTATVGPHASLIDNLARWQVVIPVVSSALAVLSFIFGGLFSAYQSRQSAHDAEMSEWRSALQRVSFEEHNLIPSGYLLESFSRTEHRDQARQLELAMLDRTVKPETFDILLEDIVEDWTEPAEIDGILDVQKSLLFHLHTIHSVAVQGLPANQSHPSFEEFLANPTEYFDPGDPSTHSRLNATLILLWKLDTFSEYMSCLWDQERHDCSRHVSFPVPRAKDMIIVNHVVPSKPGTEPGFRTLKTCTVHHVGDEEDFQCDLD